MKINKKSSIVLSIALAGAAMMMGAGCVKIASAAVGAAVGAGTVAYVGGKLYDTLDASLDVTYQAAIDAVNKLEFTAVASTKDGLQAQVEAENSNSDSVKIYLTKASDITTKIAIRIGFFGDEQQSMQVLDAVKSQIPGYYDRKSETS